MATFTGRTPESLIPRSDSRNPATTCKGITKSGRPCRRAIDAKESQDNGVLAVVSVANDSDEEDTGAAAYFCWQHKDQAEQLAAANTSGPSRQDTQLYPLQERSSIDTLVARLGVLDVGDSQPTTQQKRRKSRPENRPSETRPPKRINRPPTWNNVQGPLMSVPSDLMADKNKWNSRPPQKKKPGFWASLCCGSADDDYVQVVRPKRKTHGSTSAHHESGVSMTQAPQPAQSRPSPTSSKPSVVRPETSSLPGLKPNEPQGTETSSLLSYIPSTLSPQKTSQLLTELGKPISPHDEEGYIYIFWLTPENLGPAPSSTASTLLTPPNRPEQGRRTSDVLRQYSVKNSQRPRAGATRGKSEEPAAGDSESNTILLKIGRANNVHRRMNEWTRQCGYSLSLVRYYPYVSSTPSPSPSPQASPAHSRRPSYQNSPRASDTVRKVPHAHRVERLIHIELAEKRVVKDCEACGKQHREWFEVDATREGIKAIDETVKRWVAWAENSNQAQS
ncbi:DUF1766-domain-containing protein [Corynespora cassiicola Philippines]|uniref:DUF1766-domain-containing protein n=1 Tax=Corynespora cassiicola Philippines TaxID=1448308 RepID=A0A2T2N464_CORCC|nr:DUF1766-domain-containing protein [Corynespora cassiicola Philippines]